MARTTHGSGNNGATAGARIDRTNDGIDDRSSRFDPDAFATPEAAVDGIGGWLPVEDLTAAALRRPEEGAGGRGGDGQPADAGRSPGQLETYPSPGVLLRFARVLCRSSAFHLLMVGDRGVGKTEMLRELAFRAVTGEVPFLEDRRFVRIDCSQAPREESRAVLQAVMRQVSGTGRSAGLRRPLATEHQPLAEASPDEARSPRLVLCLDGLAGLLRGPNGGNHVADFVTALHQIRVPVIGVLSRWEYNELLAGQAEIRELCTKIELDEPSDDATLSILARHVPALEAEFDTVIPESIQKRTVALTSSFLLNERQPAKSLRVLRLACEEAAFERRMTARSFAGGASEDSAGLRRPLALDPLLSILAEITGIPRETLSGESTDADYEAALTESVVGQDEAVRVVANELRLIRGGLTDPHKPASVLLFAGLTGVGKTELAKRLAEIYSSTRRLNVYAMGNYTEPHSVSGILGVPPGYVGHDQGGRLINELNADPYSVFLLDEAEKAHPNVWKPFLNLFDEGWIEDPRGVRAWGDRAIFILTTNAGSDAIAQMTQNGAGEAEIEERVKQALARVKHERSAQPVFTPQFLARMKRTLVFRPLSEQAMIGVTRKLAKQVQNTWQQKREQTLQIDEQLLIAIGQTAHAQNQKSSNKEGGRLVRKLLSETIETPVQQELLKSPNAGRGVRTIRVTVRQPRDEASIAAKSPERSTIPVAVTFE